MPTYEYKCSNCEKTFEAFQKITEDPLKDCPLCGKTGVKRLISATAFHLKGSGWYKTDYSSGGSSSGSVTSTPASTASDTKSESKSETKPATSTESAPSSTPSETSKTPPKTSDS